MNDKIRLLEKYNRLTPPEVTETAKQRLTALASMHENHDEEARKTAISKYHQKIRLVLKTRVPFPQLCSMFKVS